MEKVESPAQADESEVLEPERLTVAPASQVPLMASELAELLTGADGAVMTGALGAIVSRFQVTGPVVVDAFPAGST